jgi:superfamily II DNA or RNA helicase
MQAGSLVEVRGQRWRLARIQRFDACTVLTLEGRDRSNAMERTRLIAPFDRPAPVSPPSLRRHARGVVLRRALAAVHANHPVDGLWTAAAARIDLHAYQLEPALAAIGGATRLLLADAVGLGKTIQAGLLLAELQQRGWIERALIICPAGLRDIWQRELLHRFGLEASIIDQQSIADRVASFPPGVNPWLADRIAIVSVDFVKRAEVMAALGSVPIDVLIADEAHHLSPGTDRGAAVAGLAARAAWCVLLSATPHSGDQAAFEYLSSIGRQGDELALFRRSRRDVGLPYQRRLHFLHVSPAPAEQRLFAAIEQYAQAIWSSRGRVDHAVRLVAITIARRASSSIDAAMSSLRRRRALLGMPVVTSTQPSLPWEDIDEADGDDAAGIIAAPGLEDLDEERAALDRLIALAAQCDTGSKMQRLMRLLHRINEPAIVFTEYRDTLEAIVARLGQAHRVMSIHGAMPGDARQAAVDAFNTGSGDVLVATDAAGEGLNLHHRCRTVIDVELPWNPLRLEQRLGRVDRIGQRRMVHAIRLVHRGTIEQQVLDRLALRGRRAEDDIARAVAERDVAAAVFNGAPLAAPSRALRGRPVATAAPELLRLSQQRESASHAAVPERCWARPRRGATRRLLVLHRETYLNDHGVIAGGAAGAHAVTFQCHPRSPREWRAAIEAVRDRLVPDVPDGCAGRDGIRTRIKAIRKWLVARQRREYQRSLFDDRADTNATERERAAGVLNAALGRMERALEPPQPAHTRIEIVAAWPEHRS